MLKYLTNKQAQILSEYAITFFLTMAVIVGMGVYVRRTLQARVHDARNTMVKTVSDRWGKKVPREYEPYITNSLSDATLSLEQTKSHVGTLYEKNIDQSNKTKSTNIQLPPKDAE